MFRWLTAEVARVPVLPRGENERPLLTVTVRRHHLLAVLLIGVAMVLVFALGVFVGYEYPYRTVPAPKVPPGQVRPNPGTCPHVMGGCLPRPKVTNAASITATNQGLDLSNNNAVYSASAWREIAAHNSFVVLKASEGIGYTDPTARPMADEARAHGLVVGGYDFLHVCLVNPTAEAARFAAALRTDGLLGKGTMPPTGDVEYGGSGCNARAWVLSWAESVYADTGRHPMLYTGAWFWNPHLGFWWPSGTISWVSGYVPWTRLPIPAGLGHVDIWQFSSNGWNGATTGDLSVWRDGARAFNAATQTTPTVSYQIYPARAVLIHGRHVSEQATVKAWDANKCANPVRRPVCRTLRTRLVWLRDRINQVAHHPLHHGHPTWTVAHRGARYQGITHRINRRTA